jgi:hypothetical protein
LHYTVKAIDWVDFSRQWRANSNEHFEIVSLVLTEGGISHRRGERPGTLGGQTGAAELKGPGFLSTLQLEHL